MLSKLGALAAILALPLLCILCISSHSASIESEIRTRTGASIQASSLQSIQFEVDGRDVVLTGAVASQEEKDRATALARAISGVRTVDNRLSVTANTTSIQSDINAILSARKIEFETGRSELLPQSIPVLEEVLKVLNQAPQIRIRVEGHTDASGNPGANRALSRARAEAVAAWLGNHGIPADRISAVGFGPDRPVADNATPEGRIANRRVEIIAN